MSSQKAALDALRIDRSKKAQAGRPGWLLPLVLAVLVLAGAGAWMLSRPRAIAVETVAAREQSASAGPRTLLNASGYVTARRAATVSSKVTGKVMEINVEEGLKVEPGQI